MPDQAEQPNFDAIYQQLVVKDEKFKEFVREHNKFTIERLKDDPREGLNPELVVLTKGMDLKEEIFFHMIACGFSESKEKHQTLFNIGAGIYEMKKVPVVVVLASECWTVKRSQNEDWKHVQPRHDPMKVEAIMVVGAGIERSQRLSIITPINRNKEDNNIIIDGESDEMDGGQFFLIRHFWRGYYARAMGRGRESKP